jgi:hypothetical protein
VFGPTADVTLEEIALEMLYPADAFTGKTDPRRRGGLTREVIRRPTPVALPIC